MLAALLLTGVLFAAEDDDPLLDAMVTELDRTVAAYEGQADAPYFLGYRVVDAERWSVSARYGAISRSSHARDRQLDVQVRVGSYDLDSSHELRGGGGFFGGTNQHTGQRLPYDAEPDAIRAAIWAATNKELRDAQEKWERVRAEQVVRVEELDKAGDFSPAEAVVDLRSPASLEVELGAWEALAAELSRRLDTHDDIHWSEVDLEAIEEDRYVVTSEGTRIRQPRHWVRVALQTRTRADDGMELSLYRWKDVRDPSRLPEAAELGTWADELAQFTVDLREAPVGEPYDGPVILRGRAAGVFVHEVLGHRVEGHRQQDEDEGQTFRGKVGQVLLPDTISIVDDPTLATYAGEDLNGHYAYDEEGVPAQRATLVKEGVFTGFLMGRDPIEGFPTSNGHGRAQQWRQPVARMANTILETTEPRTEEELRAMLVAELRRTDRPWGLVIDEIGGGFTLTGRMMPNAYNVRATYAWRVYADGRPDELVRGVDLVGTPLVALSQVIAAGDDPGVFNGFCGAESGMVPNSAVSPSLLLGQVESQKKETDSDRPPLLQKPPRPGGDS